MTYCYTTLNKPLRQTEKQRESSLIAERKFSKRNPLAEKRYDIKVLTDEEKQMAKFPTLKKRLEALEKKTGIK